jgi:hypothetical protein
MKFNSGVNLFMTCRLLRVGVCYVYIHTPAIIVYGYWGRRCFAVTGGVGVNTI